MFNTVRKSLADYQEVYLTGAFTTMRIKKAKVKFKGLFYRFEKFSEVIPTEQVPTNWQILTDEADETADLIVTHVYNRNIINDGFHLEAKEAKNIKIETSNLRGIRYAIAALATCIVTKENNTFFLPVTIHHEPSFSLRGIIEGFYGEPWSFEDRQEVINYLGAHQMNTYMYAPKDDALQRKKWRELYTNEKLTEFETLLLQSKEQQVDFYYMISPGNDIAYTNDNEIKALTNKLQQMIDIGIHHFGLLLDDIDYILTGEVARRFSHAGNAHAYLINQVNRFLKEKLADYTLVACPTEYDNRYGSIYLEDLTKSTDEEVIFFWTGPSTLASEITTQDIGRMAAVFKRPMIIWDNVPVNDYLTDKETLFLSPYENRSAKLSQSEYQVVGIVSNPMFQWSLSTFMMDTMSDYLWYAENYQSDRSLKKHLVARFGSENAEQLLPLIESYPNYYMRAKIDPQIITLIEEDDKQALTIKMENILESHRLFMNLSNSSKLKRQFQPFLNQMEADFKTWQKICETNVTSLSQIKQEKKDSNVRVGMDIVAAYLAYHQNFQDKNNVR